MWWKQVCGLLLGLWLIVAPAFFEYGDPARANDRIIGPVVISLSALALREVVRPVFVVNLLPGLWLLIAPWLLGYHLTAPITNDIVVGLLIIALALVELYLGEGQKRQTKFGGSWSALWQDESKKAEEKSH